MRKNLVTTKIVKKKSADVPAASSADLARLRKAMDGSIDATDIPEIKGRLARLKRGSNGLLPTRKSIVRDAILRELKHLKMTPYRLWKEARSHCPTLSQSAVHEFLKGQRQLELPYAEALMRATHLSIAREHDPVKKQKSTSTRAMSPVASAEPSLIRKKG
jgi:hypothetical protein